MTDTTPEVERIYRELVMALSGEERMLIGALMFDAWREFILATLPLNLTELEGKQMLFERIYGFPLPKDFEHSSKISTD